MKINNNGNLNISGYNNVPSDKAVRKSSKDDKASYTSDRVEIGVRSSADEASVNIRDNIINAEKQAVSTERLEALKQKISRNEYHIDTEDIVKSIL